MAKWKTKDIARFEHNTNPSDTRIGEVRCLLCTLAYRTDVAKDLPNRR
jgi:hypothetical protein